jgi:RimJ/RimL family protein N-acetyltransferase
MAEEKKEESPERIVFLKGEKVVLRPPRESDRDRLVRWINDPEVRHFLESYFPLGEKEEEEYLASISKRKPHEVVLAIETTDGCHIGNMGLHRIHWRDRVATTGAVIGEKQYWGKGLGTEAKMLLLDYAFNTLNLRKICSHVIAYNGRSKRYSEKCGYQEEGVLREHIYRNGEYHDLHQLAVFRDGFLKAHEAWRRRTTLVQEVPQGAWMCE